MFRVRIFAFAVACMMVAPAADAQGNKGNSNGVPGSISNIQAIIAQVVEQIAALPDVTGLEQQLADLQTELAALQTSLATATGDISNLISRVAALEAAGGGGASPVIWSGGCSTTGIGSVGAYVSYCADRSEFANSAAHLSVAPSGVVTVLKPGVYRLTYWGVSVGTTGAHRTLVNGVVIGSGINTGAAASSQRDQSLDVTWPFNEGDTFEVQVLVGNSGFAYLPWRAPAAASGIAAGSRMQIVYVGP